MVEKRLLVPERLRRVPGSGFSWVDRRFLRDHARSLSREAILLYFFLAAVSDQRGLSFWSDVSTSALVRLDVEALSRGREELVRRGLVAHEAPLTQVLELQDPAVPSRQPGEAQRLGDLLRRLRGDR